MERKVKQEILTKKVSLLSENNFSRKAYPTGIPKNTPEGNKKNVYD